RGNQTAPEVAQRRLGPLSVRHIDRRIDVARDPAAETAPGHAGIEDPAVFAVLPAQPVLDARREAFTEGPMVGVEYPPAVIGMHAVAPPGSQFVVSPPAGEVQPAAIH